MVKLQICYSVSALQRLIARRYLLCLVAAATGIGCETSREGVVEAVATSDQAIYGNGATEDMASRCGAIAAVGAIISGDGSTTPINVGCSGTLVAPSKVLTAWHCFNPDPIADPHFYFPTSQGGGFVTKVVSVSSPPWHPDEHGWGADDLYVLSLEKPVPRRIAHPIQVITGDIPNVPVNTLTSLIVGWGGNVRYDSSEGVGTRRYGLVNPVWYIDSCGDVCEAYCNETPFWREGDLNPSSHAIHAKGDSGGPLVGTYLGAPAVVGVVSGFYWWDQWCNHEEGIVAAGTGGVGQEMKRVQFPIC